MEGIRTDMAVELRSSRDGEIDGVEFEEAQYSDCITVSKVAITNDVGAKAIGRPEGRYHTIEFPVITSPAAVFEGIIKAAAAEIGAFASGRPSGPVLVIGLGNRAMTADALGSLVCERIFVTRHIWSGLPGLLDGRAANVAAIAPGVLGVTGLESEEVVCGIAERIKPSLILAVDSLVSRSPGRIGANIQVTDTGIVPGSGIGNRRRPINRETTGAAVITVGMPMVTYASTIVRDALLSTGRKDAEGLSEMVKMQLESIGEDMVVTPKNIDELVKKSAELVASAIDAALSPDMDPAEIRAIRE